MSYLAAQPYSKIIREVTSIEQKDTKQKRTLYLYPDKVVSQHREFPIENVIDMSYRSFGKDNGLLYVHTKSGLFTYTVTTSTKEFIKAYKELVKKEMHP